MKKVSLFCIIYFLGVGERVFAKSSDRASMVNREQYRNRVLRKSSLGRQAKGAGKPLEEQEVDSFFDPDFDYSRFTGRVTDRDKTTNVLKVSSENKNSRFFRTGDKLRFRMVSRKSDLCEGFIRSVEKGYFIFYVSDWEPCFPGGEYFRRGTMLLFFSETLVERVRDAALYRLVLLRRRKDFYNQLNDINHFVWSYDQQKIKTVAGYDQKIVELQKAKQRALEDLLAKKKDSVRLQKELVYRLDQLDRDLEFYRVEKDDLVIDRWHLDHDLGVPVGRRPTELKYRR